MLFAWCSATWHTSRSNNLFLFFPENGDLSANLDKATSGEEYSYFGAKPHALKKSFHWTHKNCQKLRLTWSFRKIRWLMNCSSRKLTSPWYSFWSKIKFLSSRNSHRGRREGIWSSNRSELRRRTLTNLYSGPWPGQEIITFGRQVRVTRQMLVKISPIKSRTLKKISKNRKSKKSKQLRYIRLELYQSFMRSQLQILIHQKYSPVSTSTLHHKSNSK